MPVVWYHLSYLDGGRFEVAALIEGRLDVTLL